jgi:hypothetical protein
MSEKLTNQQQQEVKKEVAKQLKVGEKKLEKEIEKKVEAKLHKKLLSKSKQTATYFGSEFKKHASTALIAAFGLVMALSWQTVIKKYVENLPKSGVLLDHPYLADLYTAIIITIIAVIGIALISRWAKKPEEVKK